MISPLLRTALATALLAVCACGQDPYGLTARLLPATAPPRFGGFGARIASDGVHVVVAAPSTSVLGVAQGGAVMVYNAVSGVLVASFNYPDYLHQSNFGRAVAISGPRVVVGSATRVFVFDLHSPTPTFPVAVLEDPGLGSDFGNAVAIAGDHVVVGGPSADYTGAFNAGRAYVYDLAGPNPTTPVLTLNNPTPARDEFFGSSVSISGSRIVVGAIFDDHGAPRTGAAYVYDLSGPSPAMPAVTLFNPSPDPNDQFGSAVACEGDRVVVGASLDNAGESYAGSVYVYQLNGPSPTIPVATLDNPSPFASDLFGASVALSGSRILVGAQYDTTRGPEAGSVYLYDLAGANPTNPRLSLQGPNPSPVHFGASVAFAGALVWVGASGGAGAAYLYDPAGETPTVPRTILTNPVLQSDDHFFGREMAMSGDYVVVLSGRTERDPYRAYFFDLGRSTPDVPLATINGVFDSPAMSGNRLALTRWIPPEMLVDIYDLASQSPAVPVLTLSRPAAGSFGLALALSGHLLVVGGTGEDGNGRLYVYDLNSATPTTPILTIPNSSFNYNGAIALDGTRLLVGAPAHDAGAVGAGAAFVYDLTGANPATPVLTLTNPIPTQFAGFGGAVGISGDLVVVGAPGDNTGAARAGSAYVYELSGANPQVPIAALRNPTPDVQDFFGVSVAISGKRVAVGAYEDTNGRGAIYIYDFESATATVPLTVSAPGVSGQDIAFTLNNFFGWSLAMSGKRVAATAPGDNTLNYQNGAVYIFELTEPYEQWKLQHFGDAGAPALGDADGDGLTNLLEYGIGTAPRISNRGPQAERVLYSEGERLRLLVQRDPVHNDVTVEVQAASSLAGPWTSVATSTRGAPFVGPGYVGGDSATPGVKTVEVRDIVNLDVVTQRFMRVRVTH